MMKQKLVNEYLLDFIGKSQKQKELDQMFKFLLEEKTKYLGLRPLVHEVSLVTVTDPKQGRYPEILKVGGSKPDDLVLNSLGQFLAAMIGPVTITIADITINDTAGGPRTISVKGREATSMNHWYRLNVGGVFVNIGSEIDVGQGSTSPARADFNIETVFANGGPEDSRGTSNTAVYNGTNGKATTSRTIGPTAGSGTVTEAGLYGAWLDPNDALPSRYMLFHDAISPGVAFIVAQNINVFYTTQL